MLPIRAFSSFKLFRNLVNPKSLTCGRAAFHISVTCVYGTSDAGETTHLYVPLVIYEQVEGFQIPVDDARRMQEVHALRCLISQFALEREGNVGDELVM